MAEPEPVAEPVPEAEPAAVAVSVPEAEPAAVAVSAEPDSVAWQAADIVVPAKPVPEAA